MTLTGACVVPASPLLVAGMSERPPAELDDVARAAGAVLQALPAHDVLVLLAGAPGFESAGVWGASEADLGGLSRPDLRVRLHPAAGDARDAVTSATRLQPREGPLPVDLAVLALQAAQARGGLAATVIPIAVPWADDLPARGRELARALPGEAVIVAGGDLSAGLTEKAPRHLIAGAGEWDKAAHRALTRGDAGALAGMGPDQAARVASRGWPGLVVLLAALETAGLRLGAVRYSAPRGVGCVVGAT